MTLGERPPLAAWPERAFVGEGAHGWFQRLAKANSQISASTLAESQGLNGRDPRPDELLEFCLRFPFAGREELVRATPILDDQWVKLFGQTLRPGLDFSFRRPRVCAACIAEQRYYRSWFDIQAMEHCPFHGLPLLEGAAGDRLAWWRPEVGVTPNGVDLAALIRPLELQERPWEHYVLGRLGLMPATDIPWFDDIALHEVIEVCAAMGRAKAGDGAPSGRSHAARSCFVPRGFELLRRGEDGLMESLVSKGRNSSDPLFGVSGAFSLILRGLAAVPANPVAERCRSAVRRAERELGIHSRRRGGAHYSAPADHVDLKEASAQLGLHPRRVRHLALRFGLASPIKSHAESYTFTPWAVGQIRKMLEESVTHDEAAMRLGLSPNDFRVLVKSGEVAPLIRLGGAVDRFDRFLPSELDAALARWRSGAIVSPGPSLSFVEFCRKIRKTPGQVALQIARGERAVVTWRGDGQGFLTCTLRTEEAEHPIHQCRLRRPRTWNGVSFAEAAGRLGTYSGAIRPLIEAGYLRMLPKGPKQMAGICPESLKQFAATYAPAGMYADHLGMAPERVRAAFREADVQRIGGPTLAKRCFVERRRVLERLGPEWDLGSPSAKTMAQIWDVLRAYLIEVGSANRLVGGVGKTARIRPGDASLYAEVTIDPTKSEVELVFSADRKLTPSRYKRTMDRLPLLRSTWPKAKCHADARAGTVTLSERLQYPPEPAREELRQIARQIDERLTVLRHLLKSSPIALAA